MSKLGIIRGKVWKFGNNISTTDITPHEMSSHDLYTTHELKDTVFTAIRPGWKDEVKPGDCIVAGENFGFGSQRASANDAMKVLKIGCIVADSIARIFYRAAISMGFPAFPCPGVSNIFNEGDELEMDIYKGLVKNLTTGKSINCKPYAPQILEILEADGIMPLLIKKVNEMKVS